MRKHEYSIFVERSYLTNDNATTVYILRIQKDSKLVRIVKRLMEHVHRVRAIIFRCIFAVLVAGVAGLVLIPAVETERGYVAFGGEFLCIAFFACIAFKVAGILMSNRKGRK